MSRPTQVPAKRRNSLRVRGSHPLRPRVPSRSTGLPLPFRRPYNPATCLATPAVWAPPRSLAATGGIVVTFFSWGYLDVSVPPVRLPRCGMAGSLPPGCPIRKSAGQRAFAPNRGLSQLVTSFFASESLGIRHAPLPLSVFSVKRRRIFDIPSRGTRLIPRGLPRGARCVLFVFYFVFSLRYGGLCRLALASIMSMCSFLGGE